MASFVPSFVNTRERSLDFLKPFPHLGTVRPSVPFPIWLEKPHDARVLSRARQDEPYFTGWMHFACQATFPVSNPQISLQADVITGNESALVLRYVILSN